MASAKYVFKVLLMALSVVASNAMSEDSDKDHDHHKEANEHKDEHGESHEHSEKEDHGHEESSSKFGEGKAIEAVKDEGKYFKLSEKALVAAEIKLAKPTILKPKILSIPSSAIVYFQDETGIYVHREGWFQLVEVSVKAIQGHTSQVETDKVKPDEMVAVKGVPFLRIAQLEALGQGGQSHIH